MNRLLSIAARIGVGCSTTRSPHHVSVFGDYRLVPTDVRAIEELVAARSDIAKPLQSIYADRPNHARINSGTLTHRAGSGSQFTVAKQHGKWIIDSPIEEEHIITP